MQAAGRILLLFFFPLSLLAVSLEEAVYEALFTSPKVLELTHQRDATGKELEASRAGYYPRVDFQANAGQERLQQTPAYDYSKKVVPRLDASLTVTQNLYNGGYTSNEVEAQEFRLRASGYRIDELKEESALNLVEAYINVLRFRKFLEYSERNLDNHHKIYLQIKEKTLSGFARRSELEQVSARRSLAKANHIVNYNNYYESRVTLQRLFGRSLTPTNLEEPQFLEHLPQTLSAASRTAFRRHPAIHVSTLNAEAGQAEFERSKAAFRPQVDLEFMHSTQENAGGIEVRSDSTHALVKLSYNLYSGGQDTAISEQQALAALQERDYLDETRRQVYERLGLAWTAYIFIGEQVKELEEHLGFARRTLEAYKEEFNLGKRELLDLLSAESELNEAEKSLTAAKYDLLFSKFRILEGMGLLVEYFEKHRRGDRNVPKFTYDGVNDPNNLLSTFRSLQVDLDTVEMLPQLEENLTAPEQDNAFDEFFSDDLEQDLQDLEGLEQELEGLQ